VESVDPDIDELKEIVKRQSIVIDDMNKTLHGMRRSQRLAVLWKVLWWAVIFLGSAGVYYYYVQPYVNQILHAYNNAHDLQLQIQNWFANLGHQTNN